MHDHFIFNQNLSVFMIIRLPWLPGIEKIHSRIQNNSLYVCFYKFFVSFFYLSIMLLFCVFLSCMFRWHKTLSTGDIIRTTPGTNISREDARKEICNQNIQTCFMF